MDFTVSRNMLQQIDKDKMLYNVSNDQTNRMKDPYRDYDKGDLLGKPSVPAQYYNDKLLILFSRHRANAPCSPSFIDALTSDFIALRNEAILAPSNIHHKIYRLGMRIVVSECYRLIKNPTLFSTVQAHEQFKSDILRYTKQTSEAIKGWELIREGMAEAAEEDKENFVLKNRRPFKEGLNPWNQFLDNWAPGSACNLRGLKDQISGQVMPKGGIEILDEWTDETEDVREAVEQVGRLLDQWGF